MIVIDPMQRLLQPINPFDKSFNDIRFRTAFLRDGVYRGLSVVVQSERRGEWPTIYTSTVEYPTRLAGFRPVTFDLGSEHRIDINIGIGDE